MLKDETQEAADAAEAEYEENLKHLIECLLVSIKTKKKLIQYFSADQIENRDKVKKEFSQGSCRISECMVDFNFISQYVNTFNKLKTYQKCGVYWLYLLYEQNKNGILADEMGLGKTAQACVFLDYMYKTQKLKNKTIIVAPTSLLNNWNNEINIWCPFLKNKKIIYYGNQNERKYLAYDIFNSDVNNINLIITSINMLTGKNDINYFRQIKKYDYLIFDEAHFLKNKNSLIYKKLQTRIFFNNKILLTGSPIQNKTEELTNLLLFLMPSIFKEKNINYAMNGFVALYDKIKGLNNINNDNNINNNNNNNDDDDDEEEDDNIKTLKSIEIHENLNELGEWTISDKTKDMIKDYLVKTIKDDVKQKEFQNKEIMLLQLIIEPYILRRSKKHVFIDMPKKHSIIIKLPLTNTQLNLYKDEILARSNITHKHLEFIQKHANKRELEMLNDIIGKKDKIKNETKIKENIDNSNEIKKNNIINNNNNINKENDQINLNNDINNNINDEINDNINDDINDEETINIEKTDNKETNIIINKREDKIENNTNNDNTPSNKESRGKLINALIFILRRICNHPLLHKYYYSVEDIKNISKYFYYNTDNYADLDLITVENEFMKISDFDIHLSIKHLISQGDNNLNKYLITKEHILNSSKIQHMLNMIKDIRKKKQKVLIFSQFTTFLDIIEEALLYEFVYEENDLLKNINNDVSNKENENVNENKEKNEKNEDENENEKNINDKESNDSASNYSNSDNSEDEHFQNIYVRLDGSTNTNERQKMIQKFINDDNVFIFLLSTKAGGVGLNLIAANHVILMDQDWNPHNDRQAEDRVHRLGQKNEVFIYRLCCTNTIEETILKCCRAKLDLDQAFGGNSDLLQTALIKEALSNVEK